MAPQILEAFIKACFKQSRRTLKNNLSQKHYDLHKLSDATLGLRSQQMGLPELKALWEALQAE